MAIAASLSYSLGLQILRPTPVLWQKEQERLTVELTTPHSSSMVSAPKRSNNKMSDFQGKVLVGIPGRVREIKGF